LAGCYGELHDFSTACQVAKEAVRLSTEDPLIASSDKEAKARFVLRELLQKSGDMVAAREELNRALVLANTGQSTCFIARIKSALEALG
jgi:gentisate 1,2-dioxygenase